MSEFFATYVQAYFPDKTCLCTICLLRIACCWMHRPACHQQQLASLASSTSPVHLCRHNLQSSYAYALAARPEYRDVILIAQPIPNSKSSNVSIAAIGLDAPHTLKGPYNRSRTAVVTALAVLPGHELFAVGKTSSELHAAPLHITGLVCLLCRYHDRDVEWHEPEANPHHKFVSFPLLRLL